MPPRRPLIYNVIARHDCWVKSSTTRWMAVIKLLSYLCSAARRCLPSRVSIALFTQTTSKEGTSRPCDLVSDTASRHGEKSFSALPLFASHFLSFVKFEPCLGAIAGSSPLPSMLVHLAEYVKIGIGRQYASSRPSYCGQRDSS